MACLRNTSIGIGANNEKVILVSFILSLAACSSNPKKSEDDTKKSSKVVEVSEAKTSTQSNLSHVKENSNKEDVSKKSENRVEVSEAPVKEGIHSQLENAIKSQNDEAILKFSNEILKLKSNDAFSLNAQAMVYYKRSRFALASYLLKKANLAEPNRSEIITNLGVVALVQNEQREALQYFRKALQINPSDAIAAANAGAIYTLEKDYSKAQVALDIAYKNGVRDFKFLVNYAITLTANGKYDKANEIYQGLLKEQENNREVLFNYSILLIDHMKKYQEGLDLLAKLKFIGPLSESRNRISTLENKAKTGLQ